MNLDKAQVARTHATDHLKALDCFPEQRNDAIESLACFVANCLLSLNISEEEMFSKISEYVNYYKGN